MAELAQSSIAASPLEWRDALVRALATETAAGRSPVAYLMDIGEAGAAFLLPALGRQLILLLWPPADQATATAIMQQRVGRVLQAGGGRPYVVLVGGGAAARRICEEEQPSWTTRRAASFFHLSEDGTLWGARGRLSPLAAAVAAILSAIGRGEILQPLDNVEAAAIRERFRRLAGQEKEAALSLRRRGIPGTIGLLAAMIAVYCLELAWGGTLWGGVDAPWLFYKMGSVDRAALLHGEWWRLLSPAFLHANLLHIGVNGWSLWVLGTLMERLFGTSRFLVLYTLGAIAASVCSATFNSVGSVGASGAIFALMGALVALVWRPRGLLPPFMVSRLRRTLWPVLIANVAISMAPGVDWYAHLGGTIAGLVLVGPSLLTRGLPQPGESDGRVPRSPGWITGATLSAVALGAAVVVGLVHGRAWDQDVGALHRVTLGSSRLSIDMPQQLGPPQTHSDAQSAEYAFGQFLRTPVVVTVRTVRQPDVAEQPMADLSAVLLSEARKVQQPGFHEESPPSAQQTPIGVVVHVTNVGPSGERQETWLTASGAYLVRLDLISGPGTPPEWQDLSATLVGSLHNDAAGPPPSP